MNHRRAAQILLAALLPPAAAAQGTVSAANPSGVLDAARKFGPAELTTDKDGDPLIRGTMDETNYTVFFYGCETGANCKAIQLWTFFDAGPAATLEDVNAWNATHRFSKAYIDSDGDVAVEFDVNLFGGVTAENLEDTFDWWRLVLEKTGETFGSETSAPLLDPGGDTPPGKDAGIGDDTIPAPGEGNGKPGVMAGSGGSAAGGGSPPPLQQSRGSGSLQQP